MFYIKNTIFLQFTPRQKSALLSFIKSFVKKNKNLTKDDIIDKFIEEENYYFEINNPHFEFIIDYLSDEDFIKDLRTYIDSIFYELEQKEKMQFLIDKEKKYQKEQRKKANDYKMSKLKPTKKQLIYYEKIARAHNIKPKDTKDASRLDLRNWIMDIIEPERTEWMKKTDLIKMLINAGIDSNEAKAEVELILEFVLSKTKEKPKSLNLFNNKGFILCLTN